MTDNQRELSEILNILGERHIMAEHCLIDNKAAETERAVRCILDWHNKQMEAKLAHLSEYAESVISIDENGEFEMKAIPLSLVAIERSKLQDDDMAKKRLSIYKDVKVVELDTNKQYAIIFPDYTNKEYFEFAVKAIRDIGVEKFIAIHKASDTKFMELSGVDGTEN